MATAFAALSPADQVAQIARAVDSVIANSAPLPADAWTANIVRQVLQKEVDRSALASLTAPLGAPHADAFADALYARYADARHALALRATSALSRAHLSDVDWKVHVTVASDKLSGMRQPALLLQLSVKHEDGTVEPVLLELPPAQLDALLADLAPAQTAMQQLRV